MRTLRLMLGSVFVVVIMGAVLLYVSGTRSQSRLVDSIYEVFDQYQIPYDIDAQSVSKSENPEKLSITGISEFKEQVARYLDNNEPIAMIMVGFPFKSANTQQKVFGYMPDMAERKSLEYLQSFLSKIKALYAPGARITIFTDGVAFAPFLGIPFDQVIAYEQGLVQLSSDLPDIVWHTSADMMKKHQLRSLEEINILFDTYPPTNQQYKETMPALSEVIKQRIAIELDHPAGRKLLKNNTLESIVFDIVAREARMRNYISKEFPPTKYIRLTVHFSGDLRKKFGIRVSPHSEVTPYHGVCVMHADGSWAIEFKKDVDKQACHEEKVMVNGIDCPFYRCDN